MKPRQIFDLISFCVAILMFGLGFGDIVYHVPQGADWILGGIWILGGSWIIVYQVMRRRGDRLGK
jgi:hypothetical protein